MPMTARLIVLRAISALCMDDNIARRARLLISLYQKGHACTSDVRMLVARAQEPGGMLAAWMQKWASLVTEALAEE